MKQTIYSFITALVLSLFIVPTIHGATTVVPPTNDKNSPTYSSDLRLKAGRLTSVANCTVRTTMQAFHSAGLCIDVSLSDDEICKNYDIKDETSLTKLEELFKQMHAAIYQDENGSAATNVEVWGVHLPYETKSKALIDDADDTRRANALAYQKKLIEFSIKYLKPKVIVTHPGGNGYVYKWYTGTATDLYHHIRERSRASVSEMQKQVDESNKVYSTTNGHEAILCVENCMRSVAYDALSLLDYLDCENKYPLMSKVRICLDTGHALIPHNSHYLDNGVSFTVGNKTISDKTGIHNGDPVTMLRLIGSRLGTLHIQQNVGLIDNVDTRGSSFSSDTHLQPFNKGLVDWGKFYQVLLEEIGYRGCFLYEVSYKDTYKGKTADIASVKANYEDVILPAYKTHLGNQKMNTTDYLAPDGHNGTHADGRSTVTSSVVLPKFFKMRRERWNVIGKKTGKDTDGQDIIDPWMKGDIKRVLQYGNKSIVLTQEEKRVVTFERTYTDNNTLQTDIEVQHYWEPHLYIINHRYISLADYTNSNIKDSIKQSDIMEIDVTSTGGITQRDDANLGEYSALSDIAITADGYLVGCSYTRCYPSGSGALSEYDQVGKYTTDITIPSGAKFEEGVLRFYKWAGCKVDELEGKNLSSTTTYTVEDKDKDKATPITFKIKRALRYTAGFERGDVGRTMAFSGNLADGTFTYTAMQAPAPGTGGKRDIRFVHVSMAELATSALANVCITKSNVKLSVSGEMHMEEASFLNAQVNGKWGLHHLLEVSPLVGKNGEKRWVIGSNQNDAVEFQQNTVSYNSNGTDDASRNIKEWEEVVSMPHRAFGESTTQPSFFRYANRVLMVGAYEEDTFGDNNSVTRWIKGIRLWDVTDGFGEGQINEIELINMRTVNPAVVLGKPRDISNSSKFLPVPVLTNVEGADLTLYFFIGEHVLTATTKEVEQARRVFAYDLKREEIKDGQYTFSFKTNKIVYNEAKEGQKISYYPHVANLIMYDSKGAQVGSTPIIKDGEKQTGTEWTPANDKTQSGTITFSIACADLVDEGMPAGIELSWGIEVADTTVYNWQKVNETSIEGGKHIHNIIDNTPESEWFGQIYRADYLGDDNNDNALYVHNQLWKTVNTAYKPQTWKYPRQLAVDNKGKVYFTDQANVYVITPTGNDFNSYTTFVNNDMTTVTGLAVKETNGSQSLAMWKKEDGKYYIRIYDIQDKTFPAEYTQYSSSSILETGWADACIVPYGNGYFVGRNVKMSTNQQAADNPALLFVKESDGSTTYNSWNERENDKILGNLGAGIALTPDTKYLIVNTALSSSAAEDKSQFSIYEVTGTDDAPTLDLKYQLKHDVNSIWQMNFDYAGNLVVSCSDASNGYLRAYAVPTIGLAEEYAKYVAGEVTDYAAITPDENNNYANRRETPSRSTLVIDGYDRVFVGGTDNENWSTDANWYPTGEPDANHRVRIDASVIVDGLDAHAGYIDILKDDTHTSVLTIAPTGGLTVGGSGVKVATETEQPTLEGRISSVPVPAADNPNARTDRNKKAASSATEDAPLTESDILVQAGYTNAIDKIVSQGSLALHNEGTAAHNATVQLFGEYVYDPDEDPDNTAPGTTTGTGNRLTWQYIGIPLSHVAEAGDYFSYSWMYQWNEEKSLWDILSGFNNELNAWTGYLLTQPSERTYTMAGQLQPSKSTEITLSCLGATTLSNPTDPDNTEKNYAGYPGANFLANSWTAPIQISKLTSAFSNDCDKTIYLYAPTKRKYITVPVDQAETIMGQGKAQINPLQGFFVRAKSANQTFMLDYSQVVNTDAQTAYVTDEQLADIVDANPDRVFPAPSALRETPYDDVSTGETDEKPVMRIYVRGTDGNVDNVILIEDEAYTLGFDNGSDGRKMAEGDDIPYLTATSNDGEMAVLATPSLYGTFLNFRKGTAQEYTLTFDYNVTDSDLVLQDLLTKQSIEIVSGATYTFTATENEVKTRFRISHREDSRTEYEPTAYVANNRLYLENPTNELIGVAVFTVDGKLVQRLTTRDALTDLDVPNQGLYLVEITMSDKVITIKQIL